MRGKNLFRLTSLLLSALTRKYGGSTTLNELLILNYGFVCHLKGKELCVTGASTDLRIPKSTTSRILTKMRANGLVREFQHPTDRRRTYFRLAEDYLAEGSHEIGKLLEWCAQAENGLAAVPPHGQHPTDSTDAGSECRA